jgi:hypothetical protein
MNTHLPSSSFFFAAFTAFFASLIGRGVIYELMSLFAAS